MAAIGFSWILASSAAVADTVGEVIGLDLVAELPKGKVLTRRDLHRPVLRGDTVVTRDERGRISVSLTDGAVLQIGPNSEVVMSREGDDPRGYSLVYDLEIGWVRVVAAKGSEVTVCAPDTCAETHGTDYIVTHLPADGGASAATRVIAIEGEVLVRNTQPGAASPVLLRAGQETSVIGGRGPSPAAPVPASTMASALAVFAFIGDGRPESLSHDHPLLIDPLAPTGVDVWGTGVGRREPRTDELPGGVDVPIYPLDGGLLIDLLD
jgi:hypothetical protein